MENKETKEDVPKIPGHLRVRQPEDLFRRTIVQGVPGDGCTRPCVTAEQLNKALENLQTKIRRDRQGQIEAPMPILYPASRPITLSPRVNTATSITTTSRPLQSSNTNAKHTIGCIIWVHLQASICTEWEQNSMVLTPGAKNGSNSKLSSAPFLEDSSDPQGSPKEPIVPKVISGPEVPLNESQKKPKTIHRCILQRAAKTKLHSSSLTCHICNASYDTYADYYQHLIQQTCAKNKSARLTVKADNERHDCEPELKRSKSSDEDDIKIEAEFLNQTSPRQQAAVGPLKVAVPSSSPLTSIFSVSGNGIKRGRPPKLNLAALQKLDLKTVIVQPTVSTTTCSELEPSITPLNLSTKSAENIDKLPPLLPIERPSSFNRLSLGSSGSIADSEISPNGSDDTTGSVFSGPCYPFGAQDVNTVREMDPSGDQSIFLAHMKTRCLQTTQHRETTVRTSSGHVSTHEEEGDAASLLCPHLSVVKLNPLTLADHTSDQSTLNNLKIQVTNFLASVLGEDQLCDKWNYPDFDILTIVENILEKTGHIRAVHMRDSCTEYCDAITQALPASQLRFRFLRREIFVARSNLKKLLYSFNIDQQLSSSWRDKPVEQILFEILSIIPRSPSRKSID